MLKLTHRDLPMLTRYAIVSEAYAVVHDINNAQVNCNRYVTYTKFIKL